MKHLKVHLVLGLLLAAHFLWIASHVVPAYLSPDADGYFAQARLIATEGRLTCEIESPVEYVGIHWLETSPGKLISRYPPGLPVVLAAVWKTLGRQAVFYVNPLLATLTLLFLFLLCRPYIGDGWALAAALIYAVNPLANQHAIHSDSHTASAFFLVTGLWMLESWLRRGGWWRALGAGILLGWLPAVRYAETVAAIGVVVLVLTRWSKLEGRRREVLALAAGAAVPAGLLLIYNSVHFGAFWKTAYALTNEQQITWEYFARNWRAYLEALMSAGGVGIFFAVGVAGLAGMLTRRDTRPFAAGLGSIVVAISVVYMGYYFARGPQGASIRFLLPTIPLYLPPALWLFKRLNPVLLGRTALGALLVIQLADSIPASENRMTEEMHRAETSATVIAWAENHIPPGSIVVADRLTGESLHFTGKWKLADANFILGNGRGARREEFMRRLFGDQANQPRPMQPGKLKIVRSNYQGLTSGEHAALALQDLTRWADDSAEIFWIGDGRQIERFERLTEGSARFEPAGEIKLPEFAEFGARGSRFGVRGAVTMPKTARRRLPGQRGPAGMPPPPEFGAAPGGHPIPRGMRPAPLGGMPGPGTPERLEVYRLKEVTPSHMSQPAHPRRATPSRRTVER